MAEATSGSRRGASVNHAGSWTGPNDVFVRNDNTDFADKKKIDIIRGTQVKRYDYRKIESGRVADPLIRSGDIIRVEESIF